MLQDLGVLRQHEAEHEAALLRLTLWRDKSGWAQARVKAGYDEVSGLWDIAQRLNEEKARLSQLSLALVSQRHKVAAYAGEAWQALLDYLQEGKAPEARPVARAVHPTP